MKSKICLGLIMVIGLLFGNDSKLSAKEDLNDTNKVILTKNNKALDTGLPPVSDAIVANIPGDGHEVATGEIPAGITRIGYKQIPGYLNGDINSKKLYLPVYGNPNTCTIGTSKIYECFSDIEFAKNVLQTINHSVTGLSQALKIDEVMQQEYIDAIKEFPRNVDINQFGVDNVDKRSVYFDGLSIFKNITKINILNYNAQKLVSVGDLGKIGDLPNLKTIFGIDISNVEFLVDTGDLGDWGNAPKLETIEYVAIEAGHANTGLLSKTKLRNIGDLGNWGNAPIKKIDQIKITYNESLESVGDLGNWGNSQELESITRVELIKSPKLKNMGDLGNWGNASKLKTMHDILIYDLPELISVGDLSKIGNAVSIEEINRFLIINAPKIISVGDLSTWSKLTNVREINFEVSNTQVESIGDLETWNKLPKLENLFLNLYSNKLTSVGNLGEMFDNNSVLKKVYIDLDSNQLTSVGDLGKWKNAGSNYASIIIQLYNNQIESLGDLSQLEYATSAHEGAEITIWAPLNKIGDLGNLDNVTSEKGTVNLNLYLRRNLLTKAPVTNKVKENPNRKFSLIAFEQFLSSPHMMSSKVYANSHDYKEGDMVEYLAVPYNPFNFDNPDDHKKETLASKFEQYREEYKLKPGETYTEYDVKSDKLRQAAYVRKHKKPVVMANESYIDTYVRMNDGVDQAATYPHGYETDVKEIDMAIMVRQKITWVDLSIDAEDFRIALSKVNSVDNKTSGEHANTEVDFYNEWYVRQNVKASVDPLELSAIQKTKKVGVYPLTFTYEFEGIKVAKTIDVTVYSDPTPSIIPPTVVKPSIKPSVPATGDYTVVNNLALMLAVSAMAIGRVLYVRKKEDSLN